MGAVVKQLFASGDWASLLRALTPATDATDECHAAVAALQKCLAAGKAQLVGSAAAGLHLPRCDADIVVLLPNYRVQSHSDALSAVTSALKSSAGQSEGSAAVQQGEFSVQCTRKGLNVDILVGSQDPIGPLDFLDPALTAKQRQALSASSAVPTTAFLQQQPALFKLAVRLVKYWAKHVHGTDWNDQLRDRPKSYLLVLLTLKAYQQYLISAVAGDGTRSSSSSSSSSSAHDQAAALDTIMVNFLRLAAQLSTSTLMYWELQYSAGLVQQVLARPDLVHVLRPKGCERHPLVLDLANPCNNVAAAVPGISRLVQLAASDLAAVEGDMIKKIELQLQQLKVEQEAAQKQQQEQTAALQQQLQQQGKKLAVLQVYQNFVCTSKSTCSFNITVPVSKWLPDNKATSVAGPSEWSWIPGLWLEAFSLPYNAAGYGSKDLLVGVEVRLSKQTADMQGIIEQGLPIAFKVLSNSTVTLDTTGSGGGSYYGYNSSVSLDSDVVGVLRGSTGVRVLLNRSKLSRFRPGLVESHAYGDDHDLRRLKQAVANKYSVKFELEFIVGV